MEFSTDTEQLADYDRWANRKLWSAVCESGLETHKPVLKLFSHILAARAIWAARITGETAPAEVWPEFTARAVSERLEAEDPIQAAFREINNQGNGPVTYSNSSGKKFTNELADIMLHVTIHGQHHRAQIALLIREKGYTPPVTDYIFYLRSKR